jgi:hypothetical protein
MSARPHARNVVTAGKFAIEGQIEQGEPKGMATVSAARFLALSGRRSAACACPFWWRSGRRPGPSEVAVP